MNLEEIKKSIIQKNVETEELIGPCLHVFDEIIDGRREKRRLFRCFNVKTKQEYYKVELNLTQSKVVDNMDMAFEHLFSKEPF